MIWNHFRIGGNGKKIRCMRFRFLSDTRFSFPNRLEWMSYFINQATYGLVRAKSKHRIFYDGLDGDREEYEREQWKHKSRGRKAHWRGIKRCSCQLLRRLSRVSILDMNPNGHHK